MSMTDQTERKLTGWHDVPSGPCLQLSGLEPASGVNPEEVVALGAALQVGAAQVPGLSTDPLPLQRLIGVDAPLHRRACWQGLPAWRALSLRMAPTSSHSMARQLGLTRTGSHSGR